MNIVIVNCRPRPRPSTSIWARTIRFWPPTAMSATCRRRTGRSSRTRISPCMGGRGQVRQAARRDRQGAEGRDRADPRHRPRSRGRGHFLARASGAEPQEGPGQDTVERVVFNAITRDAVLEAMQHPREIDGPLVDAYLARRALDYLVGFTLSPVLWRKLPGARSAGRVQSVALRLVCDRELEIETFKAQEYWSVIAELATGRPDASRPPHVDRRQEARQARHSERGRRRAARGGARRRLLHRRSRSKASSAATRRRPSPPRRCSRRPRASWASPRRTMQVAQRLYEGVDIGGETVGLITYMRTDGVQIAPEADQRRRARDREAFGERYVPDSPAPLPDQGQERAGSARGHPADRLQRKPDASRAARADQAQLYELIWKRTSASQMASAELERTTVDIEARADGKTYGAPRHRLRWSASTASSTLYQEGRDDDARTRTARACRDGRGDRPPCSKVAAEPAFHRAAAALLRSDPHQEDGGARHRPAVDLRRDPRDAARSRLCPARQEAPHSGGQGPPGHGLPGELLRPLRRIRLHRRPRGEARPASPPANSSGRTCCATSGAISRARCDDIKDLRVSEVLDALNDMLGAAHLPGARPMAAIRAPARPAAPARCR